LEMIRISLGLDEQNFNVLLGGTALTVIFLSVIVLFTMTVRAARWIGRRRRTSAPGVVMLEEDVVDVILESDISVSSSDVELVEEEVVQSEGASERKLRREIRSQPAPTSPLPPLPPPDMAITPPNVPIAGGVENSELPPPMPMNRNVLCESCGSRFEVSSGLKVAKCPVCDERITLW